ncbi:MAG TPA: NADH:flavin oxidoreductase [Kofleriaceae bacterium]|nr:NADH:flavin oxidoreductase [Kofleriaceae bacterium]
MWQPPERIKHALPDASWPSADEAAASRLFSPIAIGPRTAAQRTWVPAMVPWRATEDGFVTRDVIDWYRRFAEGRPGVLVVEATGIRDIPSGPLLRIGADRFVPGLRDLVSAVREASGGETLLFIQIIDFLAIKRRPPKDKFLSRFLEITARHRRMLAERTNDASWASVPEETIRETLAEMPDEDLREILSHREAEDLDYGYRERVTDMHLPHIRELPQVLPGLFADAAARAADAGFDGVELHYAHAYTMASFLSARNTREDGYGGSREHRVRLPLEVAAAARARVDGRAVVGCRYLGDDVIEGGNQLDDAVWFGVELARAGLDYLSISKGGKFEDAKQPKVGATAYPYTGPSGYECMPTIYSDGAGPFGRNVPLAGAVRAAVHAAGLATPVVAAGGICEFAQAEDVLARGEADLVAAARQSLADPDWWMKMRTGRGSDVRRCEFTNYCEALDQQHKQVTCKLWDREQLDEPDVRLASDGKRRLLAPRWRR